MGDATMATIGLAATSPHDLICVQGDGARQMVADPVPAILENIAENPHHGDATVTYFHCVNGALSVIQSYQQRVPLRPGGRQMQLYTPLPPEGTSQFGDRTLHHRILRDFEPETIREALLARRRINVFSVLMTHNNEADGLGLATAPGWQRPWRGDAP